MITNSVCKAKNPAECRFHGTQRLAPMKSSKAKEELNKTFEKLYDPKEVNNFPQNKAAFDEAKANYSVTKKGIEELETKATISSTQHGEDSDEEIANKRFAAEIELEQAKSNRLGMLESYSEALIEDEFGNGHPADVVIAKIAAFNNFALLEQEGELDRELVKSGLSRPIFFERITASDFSNRLGKVEAKFTRNVHETNSSHFLNAHKNLRNQIKDSTHFSDEWLQSAVMANEISFLS